MKPDIARYPDSDLQAFKSMINDKLEKSRQEAASLKNRLDDIGRQSVSEGGHSFGENSKSQEGREFLAGMYERQLEKIHALELALLRVANKTYGVDQNTGDLISKDRLMAMPTALSSMKWKK